MKKIFIIKIIFFLAMNIQAQNSLSLSGFSGLSESQTFIGDFEYNSGNFSMIKDWNLSLTYGAEFSGKISSNLYKVSVSKRISDHFFTGRYTPGYEKEFIFNSGQTIINADSTTHSLQSAFTYKEIFGAGYSYNFSESFNAGFTLRYFSQEFRNEVVEAFLSDSNSSLSYSSDIHKANFWKADLGVTYKISNFIFGLSSNNLFNIKENSEAIDELFYLKNEKEVFASVTYSPLNNFDFSFLYESAGSFQAGLHNLFNINQNNLGIGFSLFHDKYQQPFIAGILPILNYSTKYFGISLSGIKYFSDRNITHSYSDFLNEGFNNVINNRYSFDKVLMTLSVSLNTNKDQQVELIDIEILENIYPTLAEKYFDFPFAVGKAVNVSDKTVTVKPLSKIEGINDENIQSPSLEILPGDTIDIPFYTIIPENISKEKIEITYADFYLTVSEDAPDDNFQKPLIINSSNAWDGKVNSLKYFIKKDMNFSIAYTRNILSRYKRLLDTLSNDLAPFYKSKIIFEELVKNLVYISDPRATAEYVQFPNETIKVKGGDCDDLSTCYSSLLESAGIETALVDYKGDSDEVRHVNVLLNTELTPDQVNLITGNENKYIIRKNSRGENKIWIPVETTSLTDFNTAWETASEKFYEKAINNYGLSKGSVEIIDLF